MTSIRPSLLPGWSIIDESSTYEVRLESPYGQIVVGWGEGFNEAWQDALRAMQNCKPPSYRTSPPKAAPARLEELA